ncbi:MAG TPA: hypothetical protein VGF28_15220 [Thermoanaerobaculia bacterium]|jgi:hypothetical protein
MRNSVAVVAVAALGLFCLIYGIPGGIAVAFNGWNGIPYAVLAVIGIILIASRRRVAAWLTGDSEEDSRALAFGLIGALGLLLVLTALRDLAGLATFVATRADTQGLEPWYIPVLGATTAARFIAGLVLLMNPGGIARGLDAQPDDVSAAVRIQTILFGALALWVLVNDVPTLLVNTYKIWSDDDRQSALSMYLPDVLASAARVLIAAWIFAGRERVAAFWHRLRPMT